MTSIDKYLNSAGLEFVESIAAAYPFRAFEGCAQLVDTAHAERPLDALAAVSPDCAEKIRAGATLVGDDPNVITRAYAELILSLVKKHVRQKVH